MDRLQVDSPHTRGWTRLGGLRPGVHRGFPAHAGMDPDRPHRPDRHRRIPRTRGDGPSNAPPFRCSAADSPHTRGWTQFLHAGDDAVEGFPAHAGMDLAMTGAEIIAARIPRTRGDGPKDPRVVGGTLRDSPHTRGWTRHRRGPARLGHGFPAHAGMDPATTGPTPSRSWIPRTRGDGPLDRRCRRSGRTDSPHTRGWTRGRGRLSGNRRGFPAHAGMDPHVVGPQGAAGRIPRTRGDGPVGFVGSPGRAGDSPHTRGWTRIASGSPARRQGFPAHAGMDPESANGGERRGRIPRTRGDGPQAAVSLRGLMGDSPHTRGWTAARPLVTRAVVGFPAHAGMDPS